MPRGYPKSFIGKKSGDEEGNGTYPHGDLPAGHNHLPMEGEPQRVTDRDQEKDCPSQ